MQLTVLGATGPIGQQVLQQALAAGHRVTALVRDPARLPQRDEKRVTVVTGDAASAAEVEEATGQPGPDLCPGSGQGLQVHSRHPHRRSRPGGHGRGRRGASRLALGSGDTARRQSLFQATASKLAMGTLMADKGIADQTIARSDHDWTIALPVLFGNGQATAGYKTIPLDGTQGRIGGRINRADVADFLLSAATSDLWVRRRVILTR
ncbi:NAD(P)H-binding protein [Streptomyces sp. MS1.HAVA.3]|uniref:NAD(P)H-binding protein n=1 Tax=Streptomyces caledonius TaxID=3134107 RepID=A0ABU8TXU9_9ACTN